MGAPGDPTQSPGQASQGGQPPQAQDDGGSTHDDDSMDDGPDDGSDGGGSGFDAAVKIAVVVQRYGLADQRRRRAARALHRRASRPPRQVEVLTTCATDYVTWRNELEPGVETVNGVAVRRFRVKHERDPRVFGATIRARVRAAAFARRRARLARRRRPDSRRRSSSTSRSTRPTTTYCLFFSYRYYHAYYGARAARGRAILVPTAERDADDRAVDVSAAVPRRAGGDVQLARRARDDPRGVRQRVVPGVVVGVGSDVPQTRRRPRGSGRSTTSAARSRSTSAASTRTRAAPSCSSSSRRYLARSGGQAVARADRQLAAADPEAPAHPPSRVSRRHRQVRRDGGRRSARSCRRTSRACRWWRSRRGRSAGRCSPTAGATCSRASASAATPGCTTRTLRRVHRAR